MKLKLLIFLFTYISACGTDKPSNVTDCIMYSTDSNSCCFTEVNKQPLCLDAGGKYYGSKTINNTLYTCDLQYIKTTDIQTSPICSPKEPTNVKDCGKYSTSINSCCLTYKNDTPTCIYLGYKALHDTVTADFSTTPISCIGSNYYRYSIFLILFLFAI
jgi:hypothetical protein